MPAVSVIMPAFNAERYLHTAVDSVLRQTFADLELLIVDDGSMDETVAIAEWYADRDARVRVLRQKNAGPGPARNTGFRAAAGRYFAFLDSDDAWDDTFLAEQVAVLDARPDVDVVIGNARNRGGSRDGQPSRPVRGEGLPMTLAEILADETCLFIMAVFRREVVDTVGGFDPALLTNEEYEMWIRAAVAGFTFTRHTKPLGWYTCRADSLSSSDTRMLSGILRVFAKTRPSLPPGSPERAILDRQVARFEAKIATIERKQRLLTRAPVLGHALLRLRRRLRRSVLDTPEGSARGSSERARASEASGGAGSPTRQPRWGAGGAPRALEKAPSASDAGVPPSPRLRRPAVASAEAGGPRAIKI